MASRVTIRPRRADDLDELAAILTAVHEKDGYPVEGVADPRAWLTLTALLGAWVAEVDGKLAGHVALTQPGSADDAARLWIEQSGGSHHDLAILGRLFVAQDARGRQLGSQLVRVASNLLHRNT